MKLFEVRVFNERALDFYRVEANTEEEAEAKATDLFAQGLKEARGIEAEVVVEIDPFSENPLSW